ncbi:MAG: arylesterase [Burkholderiales bacterium]|nr:arylesterase [Burkholderiales bacterium]
MLKKFLLAWLTSLLLLPVTAWAGSTILIYGDSLSAAYGLAQEAGWAALLQARLEQKVMDYTVTNASISGETSSGGAARIAEALKVHKPRVVIVALGANDGLRGLPTAQMRANLAKIVSRSQQAKARVLLVGMRVPPNYGASYTRQFAQVYTDLAREYKTALAPFLLEGMADQRELFQADNLHPTAAAQPILLENVWQALRPLLK